MHVFPRSNRHKRFAAVTTVTLTGLVSLVLSESTQAAHQEAAAIQNGRSQIYVSQKSAEQTLIDTAKSEATKAADAARLSAKQAQTTAHTILSSFSDTIKLTSPQPTLVVRDAFSQATARVLSYLSTATVAAQNAAAQAAKSANAKTSKDATAASDSAKSWATKAAQAVTDMQAATPSTPVSATVPPTTASPAATTTPPGTTEPATTTVPPAATSPVSTDPAVLAKSLNDAASLTNAAIAKADPKINDAQALQKKLLSIGTPDASLSVSAQIDALEGTGADLAQIAPFLTEFQSADKKTGLQVDLTTAKAALDEALKDATGNTDSSVTAAVTTATISQKNVATRIASIVELQGKDTDDGSFDNASKAFIQGLVNISHKANDEANNNAVKKLQDTSTSTDIRSALSSGMPSLPASLKAHAKLSGYWTATKNGLKTAITTLDKPNADIIDTSIKAYSLTKDTAEKFPIWFAALVGKNGADTTALVAYNQKIAKALKDDDHLNPDLLDGPHQLGDAHTAIMALREIAQSWPALYSAWKAADSSATVSLDAADTQLLDVSLGHIKQYYEAAAETDELQTGDRSQFVSHQYDLFYFTDVQRIMLALNPTTHLVSEGKGDELGNADQARRDLLTAESDVAAQMATVSNLKARVASLQEEIRVTQAQATDARNRAATAKVLYDHLTAQQTDLATTLTTDQKTRFDARVLDAKTALDSQTKAATDAQTAADALRDESAGLPQKLQDAELDLSSAQVEAARQKAQATNLAQLETEAFAKARDNAPYWEADGRAMSTDAAQRVIMFAYPDSKTIFIRGASKDVADVEDMISEFDRPAPQARITLWTLQFNGANSSQLAKVTQQVDLHLLLTRTLIGTVQDKLRDALGSVVNHVAANDNPTLKSLNLSENDSSERLRRYAFYEPEILTRLGFDLTQEKLATNDDTFNSINSSLKYNINYLKEIVKIRDQDTNVLNNLTNDPKKPDKSYQEALVSHDNEDIKTIHQTIVNEILRLDSIGQSLKDVDQEKLGIVNGLNNISATGSSSSKDIHEEYVDLIASQRQKLDTMGVKLSSLDQELVSDDAFVTRWTLPDPSHATTLGEMLFVLSLGKREYRQAVIAKFLLSLESGIPHLLPGTEAKDYLDRGEMKMQGERLNGFRAGLEARLVQALLLLNTESTLKADNKIFNDATRETDSKKINALCENLELSVSERHLLAHAINNIRILQDADQKKKPLTDQSIDSNILYHLLGNPLTPDTATYGFFPRFPATILGSFGDINNADATELTGNQNEILLALQARARDNVANEIKNALAQIDHLDPKQRYENRQEAHLLRQQYLPLIGWLYTKFNKTQADSRTGITWFQRGLEATGVLPEDGSPKSSIELNKRLQDAEDASNNEWISNQNKPRNANQEKIEPVRAGQRNSPVSALDMDRMAWQIASLTSQHNSLVQATPREAAADDMIKRLIITVEDDMDYFFVQPELEAIRQEVAHKGIEFGSFQRESILATNRRIARVDPRAGADLELPGATDFLDQASQLASIADRFKQEQTADRLTTTAPAAVAGAFSLLGNRAGTALGIGAVSSLLGDLLSRPRAVGSIYSINSGSLFQVTPVFDPSGQALRFQFDYASTTNVQEPGGTTSKAIPQVERHTVDTDVQLSNLELREVSRFETNNSLGVPTQKSGGIPILKELPILRDIPIVGYYTKVGGQAATRQESLIFAQTSMYPTVSDIVNLLVDVPPLTVPNRTVPKYLSVINPEVENSPTGSTTAVKSDSIEVSTSITTTSTTTKPSDPTTIAPMQPATVIPLHGKKSK